MGDSSDRREQTRVAVRWPVSVESADGAIEGQTANISPVGAYIQCPSTPGPGEVVPVTISPPDHTPIRVMAEVIWVATAPPLGMGVSFAEISRGDESYLCEVVRRATE